MILSTLDLSTLTSQSIPLYQRIYIYFRHISYFPLNFNYGYLIIIIRFLIDMQEHGHYPHQRAHFQVQCTCSWFAACMADLTPGLQVSLSGGSIAKSFHSLQSISVSCLQVILGLPGPCFVVWQRLSWLHCWSLLSFRMRSRSLMPSHASSWWWQLPVVLHCRSVWSLLCHFPADFGGWVLLMAKFHWHGALRSTHKSCTHGHMSWKRDGGKKELVSALWTSSRMFSHVLWWKAHNHRLLRACLLGSKRKLPPPVCQVQLGFPFVVCCLRGVQFPGTVYTYNQGPLSSAWAHCISCAPSAYRLCRRCCCCPLQCDRQRMGTRLNSAGGPGPYHRSWSLPFLHLLSALLPPLHLSRSRAFWHIPPMIQLR